MGVQITRAQDQDSDQIAAFLVRALPDSWRLPQSPDAAQLQRVLRHPGSIAVIARQGDRVVGLALGWLFPNAIGQGDSVTLDELLVDPGARSAGTGTALVAAFTQTARQIATAPVEIWATTDFPAQPAAGVFAKTGGTPGGLLCQYDWPQEACA